VIKLTKKKEPSNITLGAAAQLVSELGRDQPSPGTMSNWHTKGCFGVKLKVNRIGHRIYTTKPDLEKFLEQVKEVVEKKYARA
jgi:hypothetical protein